MKYAWLLLFIAVFLVLSHVAIAQENQAEQEAQEITAEESAKIGTDIKGTKSGDTYYINSGTIKGDLSGKKVTIQKGASVSLSSDMAGEVAVEEATITLPPPSNRKVAGTGTCDNTGCTFTKGETGQAAEKISGSFKIKNEGTVDVLTTATIGEGENAFKVDKFENLRFENGRLVGVALENSEISGNKIKNKVLVVYDPKTKALSLVKPDDYPVTFASFSEGTTIIGKNILFEDEKSPIKELLRGAVTKKSDKHLVYGDNSKFMDDIGNIFTVAKKTSYIADFNIPNDAEDSYIQSDIDEKAGIKVLTVHSKNNNDIEVDLRNRNPYTMIDLDNVCSKVTVLEGEVTVISDEEGKLKSNSLKGFKKTVYRSKTNDGSIDYVSEQGVGKCDYDGCKKIINTMSESKVSRLVELVKSKEINIDDVIKQLNSKDSEERRQAASALGRTGNSKAIEPLIKALEDKDKDVRMHAAEALGSIRDQKAISALIKALEDKDKDVIRYAARALGEISLGIEDKRAVEPLILLLKDTDDLVRRIAAISLGKTRDKRAVEPLIPLLKDESGEVRAYTAEALGRIGDPKATDALIPLLEDEYGFARLCAVRALGGTGGTRAVEPLIKVLEDQDEDVRNAALKSLGGTHDPKAFLTIGQFIAKKQGLDSSNLEGNINELTKRGEKLSIRDLPLLISLNTEDIKKTRDDLKNQISDRLKKEEHTKRSDDYAPYSEDFDAEKDRLTLMELNAIKTIQNSLTPETISQIGRLIQEDLKTGETTIFGVRKDGTKGDFKLIADKTELGGLAFYDPETKTIKFVSYEPNNMENNGAFNAPKIPFSERATSFSFHLHATNIDDSKYAGPSFADSLSSVFTGNGIVITSIGKGKFNIDYYTPERVVDLGNYVY